MDNSLLKKNESLNKKKFPDPKQFTNLRPEETALSNHQDQEKHYDLTLFLLLCNCFLALYLGGLSKIHLPSKRRVMLDIIQSTPVYSLFFC